MMKKIIAIILLATSLIAAPVCYKLFVSKKLPSKRGLSVQATVLKTQQECQQAFGKKAKNLIRKKKWKSIYPIQVDISNNGLEKKQLALKKTNFEPASERAVLRRIHSPSFLQNAFPGVVTLAVCTAIGFLGISFLGFCMIAGGMSINSGILFEAGAFTLLSGPYVGIATGLVAAPTAMLIFGPNLRRKNKHTKNKHFGSEKFTLEPGQTQTLYLFVEHRNYKEDVELTFKDGNGNEKTFNCPLPLVLKNQIIEHQKICS